MRDHAAVNNVAMRTLKLVYPDVLDVGCFPHKLDLVGKKVNASDLNDFVTAYRGVARIFKRGFPDRNFSRNNMNCCITTIMVTLVHNKIIQKSGPVHQHHKARLVSAALFSDFCAETHT